MAQPFDSEGGGGACKFCRDRGSGRTKGWGGGSKCWYIREAEENFPRDF